jgi:copper chaperone CopZ
VDAVRSELTKVAGVTHVAIDLDSKVVVVQGSDLDLAALSDAVDEAGYDLVTSTDTAEPA